MSLADMERFAADVKNNAALQEALRGKVDAAEVLKVASAHGYEISHEDVVAHAERQGGELGEQELSGIAAGAAAAGGTAASSAAVFPGNPKRLDHTRISSFDDGCDREFDSVVSGGYGVGPLRWIFLQERGKTNGANASGVDGVGDYWDCGGDGSGGVRVGRGDGACGWAGNDGGFAGGG